MAASGAGRRAGQHDSEQRHRLRHALEFMAAALLGDEQTGDLALHPRRDHDRARFGQRLRPRRDIRHVAEDFARRIDHHRPRIDRNARGPSRGATRVTGSSPKLPNSFLNLKLPTAFAIFLLSKTAFAFYSGVMDELGFTLKFSEPEKPWAGWMQPGRDRPLFLIGRPYNGKRAAPGNGQMVALLAPNRLQSTLPHPSTASTSWSG
jgi:hypothetical protein